MGFFDRLFGRRDEPEQQQPQRYEGYGEQRNQSNYGNQGNYSSGRPEQLTDQQAVDRYRYMLRTAPPETIEAAHAEAFAQLSPEQRRMVLEQISQNLPEHERAAGVQYGDDPRSLARVATRAEMRQPGTLERTFSSMPPAAGISMGGLMAGSFLSSMAGVFLGTMIAQSFFDGGGYNEGYGEGYQAGAEGDQSGQDAGQDAGAGADYADYGGQGDYGGGDFGGGDFGGGDFGAGDF
jgi:hypothetical protein